MFKVEGKDISGNYEVEGVFYRSAKEKYELFSYLTEFFRYWVSMTLFAYNIDDIKKLQEKGEKKEEKPSKASKKKVTKRKAKTNG